MRRERERLIMELEENENSGSKWIFDLLPLYSEVDI